MATQIEDPLTGTTWFRSNDVTGSLMTILVAVLGLGILFTIMGIARSTVVPTIESLAGQVPGVNTGGDSGLVVA